MEDFLKNFVDKKLDIAFGSSATVRGVVKEVEAGILRLQDDDKRIAYVAIDKIAVVWESDDTQSRPGFIG